MSRGHVGFHPQQVIGRALLDLQSEMQELRLIGVVDELYGEEPPRVGDVEPRLWREHILHGIDNDSHLLCADKKSCHHANDEGMQPVDDIGSISSCSIHISMLFVFYLIYVSTSL